MITKEEFKKTLMMLLKQYEMETHFHPLTLEDFIKWLGK